MAFTGVLISAAGLFRLCGAKGVAVYGRGGGRRGENKKESNGRKKEEKNKVCLDDFFLKLPHFQRYLTILVEFRRRRLRFL